MPEPAASSFLQTLADEHGVDELLFAGKSTAAPTEARVEAGSPGAPLGAAVSDGDAAGGNGHVEKPLEELPAAHDDLAMVRESLSKLAPEWLPSKLADGKGPLSQADINRRHGYTDFDDLDLGGELGVGGFSTVRVATNRSTGALFAVKSAPHKPDGTRDGLEAVVPRGGTPLHPHVRDPARGERPIPARHAEPDLRGPLDARAVARRRRGFAVEPVRVSGVAPPVVRVAAVHEARRHAPRERVRDG